MAKFLTGPTRLTKRFTNCIAPSTFFLVSASRFNPVVKRFFVKATSVLFKASSRGSGSRNPAESSESAGNPCQSKSGSTDNVCGSTSLSSSAKNACSKAPRVSEHLSEKSPIVSETDPYACGSRAPRKAAQDCPPVDEPSLKIRKTDRTSKTSPTLDDPCSPISKPETTCLASCKSEISSRASAPLDDPCARDCKLSTPPLCYEDSSKPGRFSQPPTGICPPTEENERKGRFWKRATLLVALPIVFLASVIILGRAEEEAKKPRPEFVPMEYMYRRTKRFPWGDGNHTLFHNPVKNAVPPDGYEVEDPNAIVPEQ